MKDIPFEELLTAQKGKFGEALFDAHLYANGIVAYVPVTGRAHAIDRFCVTMDRGQAFLADAKAKLARRAYPDTGINVSHYQDYQRLSKKYRLPVFVAFIDHGRRQIYGGWLHVLDEERLIEVRGKQKKYPCQERGHDGKQVRYFPLSAMKIVRELTQEECSRLQSMTRTHWRETASPPEIPSEELDRMADEYERRHRRTSDAR